MRSEFSAQTLAEIFRDLYQAERSGVLTLSRADVQKRVYFDHGIILLAESDQPDEQLGSRLVQQGQLSVAALSEGRANVNGGNTPQDLARVLINRELISRPVVAETMSYIVASVVESVFEWRAGGAEFRDGFEADGIFEADVLSTANMILHGVEKMAGFEPIREAMGALEHRLRLHVPTPLPVERLDLSPTHGFLLSRLDGNTSLADVISILPASEDESAVRFLFGMLLLGVVSYEPPLSDGPFQVADIVRDHAERRALEQMQQQAVLQMATRIRQQNPNELLELPIGATHEQIKQAYERAKEQFGKERLLPAIRDNYRNEVTLIESRLLEAYLTLMQPAATRKTGHSTPVEEPETPVTHDGAVRVEMDRAKSKVILERESQTADNYYAKARKSMREGDYHNAIQFGKLAISHNGSDARYYCLLADCQARNPEARWQRMAEANYAKATELDPWNPDYWMSLGRLYKRRGLKLRARKQFEEALKLVPNKPEIVAELEALG